VVTDEQLMLSCQAGSADAFAELFERYKGPICRFFQRRVIEGGRAEELAQDTFVAVLRGARRYRPTGVFRAYLFGIAFKLLSADRRRRRATKGGDRDATVAPDADNVIWIRRALQQLDEGDREIVMLREFENLRYDEIAAVLGVPVNTVRSRLFRARLRLRELLTPATEAHR
jgi:RNA polymerase sigma-70 factor (ECF subfamily)